MYNIGQLKEVSLLKIFENNYKTFPLNIRFRLSLKMYIKLYDKMQYIFWYGWLPRKHAHMSNFSQNSFIYGFIGSNKFSETKKLFISIDFFLILNTHLFVCLKRFVSTAYEMDISFIIFSFLFSPFFCFFCFCFFFLVFDLFYFYIVLLVVFVFVFVELIEINELPVILLSLR